MFSRDLWKVDIDPVSKAQDSGHTESPHPLLGFLWLYSQYQLLCPRNLLPAAMFLQPTLSLPSWLIDIFPLAFAFSLSYLASMIHQVHQTCQNPLTSLFSSHSPLAKSQSWMNGAICLFVCAWARTVELLELNYTSPWSMNSRSSTSNGSEYCLALFLQTGFC